MFSHNYVSTVISNIFPTGEELQKAFTASDVAGCTFAEGYIGNKFSYPQLRLTSSTLACAFENQPWSQHRNSILDPCVALIRCMIGWCPSLQTHTRPVMSFAPLAHRRPWKHHRPKQRAYLRPMSSKQVLEHYIMTCTCIPSRHCEELHAVQRRRQLSGHHRSPRLAQPTNGNLRLRRVHFFSHNRSTQKLFCY